MRLLSIFNDCVLLNDGVVAIVNGGHIPSSIKVTNTYTFFSIKKRVSQILSFKYDFNHVRFINFLFCIIYCRLFLTASKVFDHGNNEIFTTNLIYSKINE